MEQNTLIEKMKARILQAFKAETAILAEKEGVGFVESEYAQTMSDIDLHSRITGYLSSAEKKGYCESDFAVKVYTSTHNAWYSWIAIRIENELLGSVDSERVVFPNRSSYEKSFVMPLVQKEKEATLQKINNELKSTIETLRVVIKEREAKIEELKSTIGDLITVKK